MNAFQKQPSLRDVFAELTPGFRTPATAGNNALWMAIPVEVVMPSPSGAMPVHQSAAAPSDARQRRPSPAGHTGSPLSPLGGWQKRAVDLATAVVMLLLAAPVMLIIAFLIRVSTGGPALFAHTRLGFNGRPFRCYKFRTMVANSEQVLREHLAANPQAAQEWNETRKLKRDPRITFLGMMLRKSSLDELPQLFNILRGEMSCVGPRPIVAEELDRYGVSAGEYLRARPGLTGLWQVTGRSSCDYSTRVALDSQYVRDWSLLVDFVILLRTIFAVMRFDEAS